MATGCYTPRYFPASFKGVPFDAMDTGSEHGRRGAEGEFPFGENTAYADLGRRIRRYPIKGRLATNNHIAATDALIAVCESYGPGLLIHPTRGAVLVACVRLSVSDNPLEEQGVTYFDLEFVEANALVNGGIGASIFGFSLVAITAASRAAFGRSYRMKDVRYFNVPHVLKTASIIIDQVRSEFGKAIIKTTDNSKWAALSTMEYYVADPATLYETDAAFDVLEQAMVTLANNLTGQAKYDAFKSIANANALVSSLPDESGKAQNALYAAARIFAAGQMVRAATETTVTTVAAALVQYDAIIDIINEELLAAKIGCEHDLFIELRNMVINAQAVLLDRAYNLPALIEYDFNAGVHSLVAAYEILNDAKRAREIEANNPHMLPFNMGPVIVATRASA